MSKSEAALSQALAAYAGATSGDQLDARLVRARILQSTRAPRRRSLRRLSFALPLVATFAASAAFAASQPGLRAAVTAQFQALFEAKPTTPLPSRSGPPRHQASPVPHPQSLTPGPETEPSDQTLLPPVALDELPLAPAATPPGSDNRAPSSARAQSPAAEADPQLEAYRAAHRTHFDAGAPSAALAAWDRYLEDFPAGSFSDDARFNRALCLVRLGRLGEARAALQAFAAAPAGSYRQTEAASLLRELSSKQPPTADE